MAKKTHLTAREAAAELGITLDTLYAYVSRGLLQSEQDDSKRRTRRYRADVVMQLKEQRLARKNPERAVQGALRYGQPVMDSAVTLIKDGRLFYRGHDAIPLARARAFEGIAALLWQGHFDAEDSFDVPLPSIAAAQFEAAHQLGPIEGFQLALAAASGNDLGALGREPAAVMRTARRILALMSAVVDGSAELVPNMPIAERLQLAWVPDSPKMLHVINAALILSADHELNVSAFTARCVASAGATPYAVVQAGLSALSGFRHGGQNELVRPLFDLAVPATTAVRNALRQRPSLPGFGHPLYPDGDPRAVALLELLPAGDSAAHERCAALLNSAESLDLKPNIDFALAAVAAVSQLPPTAPMTLFAIGRTAGWIAHALEQYATNTLIRPRANYVGRAPSEA